MRIEHIARLLRSKARSEREKIGNPIQTKPGILSTRKIMGRRTSHAVESVAKLMRREIHKLPLRGRAKHRKISTIQQGE